MTAFDDIQVCTFLMFFCFPLSFYITHAVEIPYRISLIFISIEAFDDHLHGLPPPNLCATRLKTATDEMKSTRL